MDLNTIGTHFHIGTEIPVRVYSTSIGTVSSRFRLILIKNQKGSLIIHNEIMPIVSPTVLCLSENESYEVIGVEKIDVIEVAFHPLFIHPKYSFQAVHEFFQEVSAYKSASDQWEDDEVIWLNAFLIRNSRYLGAMPITDQVERTLNLIFGQIEKELNEQYDLYWPCRTRSYLLEALLIIDRLVSTRFSTLNSQTFDMILQNVSKVNLDKEMESVLIYISSHYSESLTLEGITQHSHMNRTTLNRRFKESFGKTVMAYVIELRIQMAKALLKNTELRIQEIMERTGFNDSTHFARSFKNHTGLTPHNFRSKKTWL